MTYKCKDCGSEWWQYMLLKGKCRDCGGEVYLLKGGVHFEEAGKSTSRCAEVKAPL